jgi:HK97 family phage major capsid protein
MNPPIDDTQFQADVLAKLETANVKIKTYQAKVDEMTAKIEDAPKEIKKFQDELTAIKRVCNDSDANMKALEKKVGEYKGIIARQAALNYGDPVERFLSDPDKRLWMNAMVRAVGAPNIALSEKHAAVLKAFTGVDSSLGAATIPTEWLSEVYSLLSTFGIFSTFGLITGISARTVTIPMATARPAGVWIGAGTGGTVEGTAGTEGSFTGSSVNLTIQTLMAFVGITRELIQDASTDISGYATRELFQSIASKLDDAALTADAGADQTDAGYRGVFDAAALNVQMKAQALASATTVAATLLSDWVRCRTTVNAAVLSRPTKWWMHPYILSSAVLVRDANGRPIFQTALEAASPGAIGSILGSPVILGDACPTTDSTGAKVAVFGDPMGQAVGIRQDFEIQQSEHFRFTSNQIVYRALTRAGVQIKSATGSTTLKPFAVLTLA